MHIAVSDVLVGADGPSIGPSVEVLVFLFNLNMHWGTHTTRTVEGFIVVLQTKKSVSQLTL